LKGNEQSGAADYNSGGFDGLRWNSNEFKVFFDSLLVWLNLLLNESPVGRFRAVRS